MKFKQFQFLRKRLIEKLKAHTEEELPPIEQMDALALAYIGDSYYSTYVRREVIKKGIYQVRILHTVVTRIICAKGQAISLRALEEADFFTEEEKLILHKGKNANVTVPKSATLWEYRFSTALEAIIGYAYLKGDTDRAEAVSKAAMDAIVKEL